MKQFILVLLTVAFINGIDGGMCYVPNVNLWDRPGGRTVGAKVSTSVPGCVGFPVEVITSKVVGPRVWYKVRTFGANKGKQGWVSETLISK